MILFSHLIVSKSSVCVHITTIVLGKEESYKLTFLKAVLISSSVALVFRFRIAYGDLGLLEEEKWCTCLTFATMWGGILTLIWQHFLRPLASILCKLLKRREKLSMALFIFHYEIEFYLWTQSGLLMKLPLSPYRSWRKTV